MLQTVSATRRRLPGALVSLLVAIGLVIIALPEVVFLGGSLSSTGLNDVVNNRAQIEEVGFYPNFDERAPRDGLRDVGSRAWQFEPIPRFVNRSIFSGESLSWNPYSASGSLGPETLVDMPMSPFILSVAILGATSTAFTFVLLAFYVAAMYCLQQFFVRTLALPRIAGIAACVVYLLNGASTGLSTNLTGQPLVLAPIVLYAVCEFQRVGGPARLAAAVAAYVGLLFTTFLPGVVLVAIFIHVTALAIDAYRSRDPDNEARWWTRAGLLIGRQAIIPVCAAGIAAVLLLPIAEALSQGGDDMTRYQDRLLQARHFVEGLSLVSPRHVYTSYDIDTILPGATIEPWAPYFGLATLLTIAGALPRARELTRVLLWTMLGLTALSLSQHLGIPWLVKISEFPLLRPISSAYWSTLAGAALTIAFGLAIATAVRFGLSVRAVLTTTAMAVAAFGYGLVRYGEPTSRVTVLFAVLAATAALVIAAVWWGSRSAPRLVLAAGVLVVVSGVELLSYAPPVRVERYDFDQNMPAYVTFVQDNVGDGRIMNMGRGGIYPEWGSAFGIRQLSTLLHTHIPVYREFFGRYVNTDEPLSRFLDIGRTSHRARWGATPEALDLLSVRYIVVDGRFEDYAAQVAERYPLVLDDTEAQMFVFENPSAYPRAYLTGALTRQDREDPEPQWTRDTTITEDDELLRIAAGAGIPTAPADDDSELSGEARITRDGHTIVRVEVDTPTPQVLVLADTFHDNWSVTVDGEDHHLGLVNETVRGVIVPAGSSEVVFSYRSPARALGWWITGISLIMFTAGCIAWWWKRRSTNDGSDADDETTGADAVGREAESIDAPPEERCAPSGAPETEAST